MAWQVDVKGGDAGPSTSTTGMSTARGTFDNSGWTVATGGGNATSTPPSAAAIPWAMLVIGAVVMMAVWKLS